MLGFGVILCLWAISLGIAYFGFERISAGSKSYQDIVVKSDTVRDIDRHLATYRLRVRYYILTGALPDQTAAQSAETELSKATKNASLTGSPEDRQTIAALEEKFSGLAALFAQIIEFKTDNAKKGPYLTSMMGLIKYKIDELTSDAKSNGFTDAEAAVKEYAAHTSTVNTAVNDYITHPDQSIVARHSARK